MLVCSLPDYPIGIGLVHVKSIVAIEGLSDLPVPWVKQVIHWPNLYLGTISVELGGCDVYDVIVNDDEDMVFIFVLCVTQFGSDAVFA